MSDGRPLRAYAEVALGRQRAPEHEDGPHMVRYLRAANVKDGALDLDDVKAMNFEPGEQHIFSLKPGDVLVTEGSGSRSVVGASAVWNGELPGIVCFQNTLLRLRPRSSTDPRFLAWWCRYARNAGLFASIATGANIFHLSADRVRSLPMNYLPPAPQRAIADFLDTETARIEALITGKRRMIDLLEERRWSEFRLATTETDAPRVPARRALVSVTDGPFGSAFTSAEYSDDGVAVIRLGNIGHAEFRDHDLAHLPLNRFAEFRHYAVRQGDVLFAGLGDERNHAGRACVAPDLGPAIVKGKCFCGRVDTTRAVPDFIAMYFSSPMAATSLASDARGSTRQMINLEILKAVEVPLPSVEQQMQIVEAVRSRWGTLEALYRRLDEQIRLMQERRQALITAAVTGELEVPGVAA